jgi:hypothetical protein
VVVELTERHPLSGLAPLWLSLHGLERPKRPSASDAVAVANSVSAPSATTRSSPTSKRWAPTLAASSSPSGGMGRYPVARDDGSPDQLVLAVGASISPS